MRPRTNYNSRHRHNAPGGTRTPDQQLRRLPLYPSELLAPALPLVPPSGSRTWTHRAGPLHRHTSYHEIGAAGFEPATSCSQSRRDTGLRYAPQISGRVCYPASRSRSTGARKSVVTSAVPRAPRPHTTHADRARHDRILTRVQDPHEEFSYRILVEQSLECATAMTHTRLGRARHLSKRHAKVVGQEIRIVSESLGTSSSEQ